MDDHIRRVEELFSAAKAEFKHLEFFYFHNCVYDYLWKNNRRRYGEQFAHLRHAAQVHPGLQADLRGRRDDEPLRSAAAWRHRWNTTTRKRGAVWLTAPRRPVFPRHAWLNPEPERLWEYRQSISVIRQGARQPDVRPHAGAGLESAMRALSRWRK